MLKNSQSGKKKFQSRTFILTIGDELLDLKCFKSSVIMDEFENFKKIRDYRDRAIDSGEMSLIFSISLMTAVFQLKGQIEIIYQGLVQLENRSFERHRNSSVSFIYLFVEHQCLAYKNWMGRKTNRFGIIYRIIYEKKLS